MKVRYGFVSNSSSSSFVVAFEKIPQNKSELRDMLFLPEQQDMFGFYSDDFAVDDVLEVVWGDMQDGPLTTDQVYDEFNGGYLPDQPDVDWAAWHKTSSVEERNVIFDEFRNRREKFGRALADKFMADNEGKSFFRFCYSDNDGDFYSALEHGELFIHLPHFVISHH